MIVHHTDRLHVRVNHGGSDEAEAATLEVFTERVGLARRGGDLAQRRPTVLARPPVDELPTIRGDTSVFFPHRQKRSCVFHRGGDLHPVPDDPWIGGQPVNPGLGIARDLLRIELAERAAVPVAFVLRILGGAAGGAFAGRYKRTPTMRVS